MRRFLLLSSAALVLAAPLSAQTTISTGAPTDHFSGLGTFTGGPTAIAQTFVTPTDMDVLQSFSFFFSTFVDGGLVNLDASVYAFAGDHLVGNALFSAAIKGTDSPDDEMLTFGTAASPLSVHLTPGTVYALVLSSLEGFAGSPSESGVTIGTAGGYNDGSLFISFAGAPGDLSSAGAFTSAADFGFEDAAFNAKFTATPEPGSLVLMATGLVGVVGFARRRSRSRAA